MDGPCWIASSAALREHDESEIARLGRLMEQAANAGTNLAVDMGLGECGG